MRICAQLDGMVEGDPSFPFRVIKEILRKLGWERGECYVECTVVEREGWFRFEEKQVHLQLFDIDQKIPQEIQKVIKARIKAQFEIEVGKFEEIVKEVINCGLRFVHDLRRKGGKEGYLDLRVSGRWNGRIRMGWSADGSGWIDFDLRTEDNRR